MSLVKTSDSSRFHAKSQTGAITFIQRFGSALNLNVHFHILFLDGVFHTPSESEDPVFHPTEAPSDVDVLRIVQILEARITRHLKRKAYLKDDKEIAGDGTDPLSTQSPLLAACVGASVQNKSALGDRAGIYVRKLGIHPLEARVTGYRSAACKGFSLHAGVSVATIDCARVTQLDARRQVGILPNARSA